MKKLTGLLLILLAAQTMQSQTKEGTITYEQKIDMYRRIPEDNAQLRSMMPQFRTAKYELLFADSQTLFKALEEAPDMTEENHGGVIMRFNSGAVTQFYRNFSKKLSTETRDLVEETYLIEDSIRSLTWKLADGETKVILGYTCKKATGKTERGSDIVAWYCEDIPVSGGPEQFNGLPGMILSIDANKGEIVFTATAINKKVEAKKIKAPTKGKKISSAEFVKKQKELFGNQPGGVRVVTN